MACGRSRRPDARESQRNADEPLRHRALRVARGGDGIWRPGWKQCGSVNVAKTPQRMQLMRRQMARAKSFGVEFEWLSPDEVRERVPLLRTDDLTGGVWIPGDGKANPDRPHAIARQGRAQARCADLRRGEGDRGQPSQSPRRRARVDGWRRARRHRLRMHRQLRRPMGARVRRARRRRRAAAIGRAFLHRHRADRRRDAGDAGDSRSGRLHLLQGGSRRHRHGRLRARRQSPGTSIGFRTDSSSSCCRKTGTSSKC